MSIDVVTPAPSTVDRALFDEMVEALEQCERTLGEVAKIIKPMANEAALVSARAVLSKVREASK